MGYLRRHLIWLFTVILFVHTSDLYPARSSLTNFPAHLLSSSALLDRDKLSKLDPISATLLEPKICGENSSNLTARSIGAAPVSGYLHSIEDFETEKKVDQLLLLMQKRLAIMHEVAKTKWNQHLPIEDKAREEKSLLELAQKASGCNLNEQWILKFFQVQMDAAKKLQMRDFNLWKKQGSVEFETVLSLSKDLRLYIDRINQEMIVLFCEMNADHMAFDRFLLDQPISVRPTDHVDQDLWSYAISSLKSKD